MQLLLGDVTVLGRDRGPGSGRRVQFDCVLILDIDNGLITHERRIYDFTGVLIQLGVLRGKPAS